MEYYSATEKNEIMPLATTWVDLEIIVLNEIRDRDIQILYDIPYIWNLQISYDIPYIWNLKKKNDTNELIYKIETDSDLKNEVMVIGGKG